MHKVEVGAGKMRSILAAPLDRSVGRSRYAEEPQAAAPRINLHAHSLIDEEVILHTFVRKRQHDYRIGQSL